ncbi:MAG: hypothetical protein HOV79_11925 [Hamadaea sp.]|nr:hypothetical protein [Hamadaea sp.]
MSEISVDVDLQHPARRVWRALTDPRLLAEWFMDIDVEPRRGAAGRAYPGGLAGFGGPFDVEVADIRPERAIYLRWRGDQMHAEVRWELDEIPGGTRLRLVQTGFLGLEGERRRQELRVAYQEKLAELLPSTLDRIAEREDAAMPRQPVLVAERGPAGGPAAPVHASDLQDPSDPWATGDPSVSAGVALPQPPAAEDSQEITTPPPHGLAGRFATAFPLQERVRATALAVTVALVVVTVGWLWLTRPIQPDSSAGTYPVATQQPGFGQLPAPSAQPSVQVSGGQGGVVPGVSGSPGASGGPSAGASGQPQPEGTPTGVPAVEPKLTAEYSTQSSTGLLGYSVAVTVTVHNPGTTSHTGWTVILTVPDGAKIDSSSSSVQVAKDGAKVTVTPTDANKTVNGGGDIAFVVTFSGGSLLGIGSGGVTGCTIDGADCGRA